MTTTTTATIALRATCHRPNSLFNAASALAALNKEKIQLRLQPRTLNLNVAKSGGSAEGIDMQLLLTPDFQTNVALWGAGKQAEWLVRHTITGQSNRIIGTVTDATSYRALCAESKADYAQGVNEPQIIPAGVQSMYEIVRNIEQAGFGSHLVRGILL